MKKAYLLTWNPERWEWNNYKESSLATKQGSLVEESWTCKSIQPQIDDDVYLMKSGKGNKGIIAHGKIIKPSYKSPHYNKEEAEKGKTLNRVDVKFDLILDFEEQEILEQRTLNKIFPDQLWSPQSSGISIKQEYIKELEVLWNEQIENVNEKDLSIRGKEVDIETIVKYLENYSGKLYEKPKKAGIKKEEMEQFKESGRVARQEFIKLGNLIENRLPDFKAQRCSDWRNQGQKVDPYFWIEFKRKNALELPHSLSLSINLHPEHDPSGPLTLSFRVELKDTGSEDEDYETQNKIVEVPINKSSGVFYQADMKTNNESRSFSNDSDNVKKEIANNSIKKLKTVKNIEGPYVNSRMDNILEDSIESAKLLIPFYEHILNLKGIKINSKEEENMTANDIGLNTILYGPPGTGKTYNTAIYAVSICDGKSLEEIKEDNYEDVMTRYKELMKDGRIAFTTFHQSYGYEEFIEGIKPVVDTNNNDIGYKIEPGIFKTFCNEASNKKIKDDGNDITDTTKNQVWSVLLDGTGISELKKECFEQGTIRIGWEDVPEFIDSETKDLTDSARRILLNFQDEMIIGDIVVTQKSNTIIDGIGIISGDYEYDSGNKNWPRFRKVKWLLKDGNINITDLNDGVKLNRNTVYPLKRISVYKILSLIEDTLRISVEENKKPYVFVIDEINRGNISKIFGELITLIEDTRRMNMTEETSAILPYSGTHFSIPSNVYILGTMNTADKSISLMDTALRRRFRFVEMMPDVEVLRQIGADKVDTLDVAFMLEKINERIAYLYDREHTIGHAFFTKLKNNLTLETLESIFRESVIPLLQEYFYEDYEKIQFVLGDNGKSESKYKFVIDESLKIKEVFKGDAIDTIDLPEKRYQINDEAFAYIESYIEII
jgi:hypothetical protein